MCQAVMIVASTLVGSVGIIAGMLPGFSQTLAAALQRADKQAQELSQEFVGAEHLLLGIIAGEDGLALAALRNATHVPELKRRLLGALPRGERTTGVTGRLPLSPTARQAVDAAINAAQQAGENTVSTRRLLAALLDAPVSGVDKALADSGADVDELAQSLRRRGAESEA